MIDQKFKINKTLIEEEFEVLQQLIDFDKSHHKELSSDNSKLDRYPDILPCKNKSNLRQAQLSQYLW
jgi:hypothetical protein